MFKRQKSVFATFREMAAVASFFLLFEEFNDRLLLIDDILK